MTDEAKPVVLPSGYTPGEWEARTGSQGQAEVAVWGVEYAGDRAWYYWWPSGHCTAEQTQRDAELIALAPAMAEEIVRLREALRRCLNFIENTEGELGITLESGDIARAALGEA